MSTEPEPLGWLARLRAHQPTHGSPFGALLALSLPMLATNAIGAVLFQVVELTFLSWLGEHSMAAVIIVNQSIWQVVLMILMGFNFAMQAVIAGAIGSGDVARAERTAGQGLLLAAGLAVVVATAGLLIPEQLFAFSGAEARFAAEGVPYLRLQLLTAFGLIGSLLIRGMLLGAGDSTTPLLVTLVQTPLALLAQWSLVFGRLGLPALGVRGVALGVAVGHLFSLGVTTWVLFRGHSRLHLRWRHLAPDPAVLRMLMRLAYPPALQMIGMVATTFAYLRLTREFGVAVQTAYSIGLRLGMIVPLISLPLASACATMVGQALGAGDVARARRAIRVSVLVHMACVGAIAVVIALGRGEIMRLLSSDPEVIRIGREYLLFLAGSYVFLGFYLVVLRALQGAGDFLVPMAISLGTTFLVGIPLASFLAHRTGMGPTGIWTGSLVGSAVGSLTTLAWLSTGRWTHRRA